MAEIQVSGVIVDYSVDGWDEYKKWLDGTYSTLQYVWADEGEAYYIVAVDGDVSRVLSINKTDAGDFETNYKNKTPHQFRNPVSGDGTLLQGKQRLVLGQKAFTCIAHGCEQLNVNGLSQGSPVVLWNGSGGGDSGGDWSVSGVGSETTESAHSGTYGWDTGVANADDITVFDNGSMIDVAGTYDSFRLWIQPKAWPTGSHLQVRWLGSADENVGLVVRLENYTTNMDLNIWQQVEIPISDFELTGNVQKLRFKYRYTDEQRHWLDDLELIAAAGGGPYKFRVQAPDANTFYHMTMLVLVVAAPQAGWDATSFGSIPNGLSNGLLLRQKRLSDGEVLWNLNSQDNADLFGRYHPQDAIIFADDTLLMGFMVKPGTASVVITEDEVLEFVVRDDLSSITNMRGYVHYGIEEVL